MSHMDTFLLFAMPDLVALIAGTGFIPGVNAQLLKISSAAKKANSREIAFNKPVTRRGKKHSFS